MTRTSTPSGQSHLVTRLRNLIGGQPKPVTAPEPSSVPARVQPSPDWHSPRLGGVRFE
jgi:hypothetical protein